MLGLSPENHNRRTNHEPIAQSENNDRDHRPDDPVRSQSNGGAEAKQDSLTGEEGERIPVL